ncbi:MAG: endonuclease III [Candidatus Woesearchaeota archaeon]
MAVQVDKIVSILKKEVKNYTTPIVTEVKDDTHDPYQVLISCLISLRTKDEVTRDAFHRLFNVADTPKKIAALPVSRIEKLIYPAGFYKTKAWKIKAISKELVDKHNSRVPDEIDDLLKFDGVGRKTANLVVTLGYNKPGICVDTHVHRISNRFGYVKTKTPNDTEFALRKKLPKEHWIVYNDLLVTWGQNVCKPISPMCSICKIRKYCNRVGVEVSR